jgi:NADPH-dependent 2,4-dienoyl-CoA reductase/sulfur reductase-like enzyme
MAHCSIRRRRRANSPRTPTSSVCFTRVANSFSPVKRSERADLLIIGAGPAGTRAAESARRRDNRARIVVLSEDAHPFYNRILLSKEFLKRDDVAPEHVVIKPRAEWKAEGIELESDARVMSLDPRARSVTLADGATIEFGRCVLAPGGRPVLLPVPGGERLRYLRSLEDAVALREAARKADRAIVVGGGLVGIEVAAALAERGLEVRLLVREAWPLGHVAPESVGRAVERVLRSGGVDVLLETLVAAVAVEGDVMRLWTTAGQTMVAPLALAGVGVGCATGFTPPAMRGPRGELFVDAALETSAPGIFAAGDAAAWDDPVLGVRHRVEHWLHAQHQGRRAGENAAGERGVYARVTAYDTALFGVAFTAHGAPDLARDWCVRGGLPDGPGAALGLDGDRLVGAIEVGRTEDTPYLDRAIRTWGRGGAPRADLAAGRLLADLFPG